MSKCYVKLFQKILDSTIWMADDKTRIVWITILAMCDENGLVDAPVPAIAARAHVDVESCRAAMDRFQMPEADSRTPDNEGRRIQKTSEGWLVLNHRKYRDMMSLESRREYKAGKAREYRDRDNNKPRKSGKSLAKYNLRRGNQHNEAMEQPLNGHERTAVERV